MSRSSKFLWGLAIFLAGIVLGLNFEAYPIFFVLFGLMLGVSIFEPRLILVLIFLVGLIRPSFSPIQFTFLDPLEALLAEVNQSFVSSLSRVLPEPHSSYLAGLLLGARSTIPLELREAFRETGTSHLTALSGFNVTIIVGAISKIFSSIWLSIFGIFLFVLLTGASSSVLRAAIMGSLVFFARHYGYAYNIRNALVFTAAVMVFISPTILIDDIAFQLSVLATAGLIYFTGPIERRLKLLPRKLKIRDAAATTLAAQIATLPLIFFYFGTVSPVAPLVNTLVLPTIPATMLFGFLAGLAGYFGYFIGVLVAWPSYLLLSYQLGIIKLFSFYF